ncbi:MAG: hypothetical protein AB7L13_15960 [Acidimicrobiia bacterium]
MLFEKRFWVGLSDGSITVAFRRWQRPTVKAGGTLKSPGGLLAIDAVTVIDERAITEREAESAGYDSRAELIKALRAEGTLYRIDFHRVGDDPRPALRATAQLDHGEADALIVRLQRRAWAVPVLRLIGEHPGVVSTELAPLVAMERVEFKQKVRSLKELGLTESLKVGYRLSPRGEALLRRIEQAG